MQKQIAVLQLFFSQELHQESTGSLACSDDLSTAFIEHWPRTLTIYITIGRGSKPTTTKNTAPNPRKLNIHKKKNADPRIKVP